MANPREKFQGLLRKLFQFDCAELDFGIYRIMNQKRDVIEKFIEKDLLDGVARELTTGALAQESGLAQQLAEVSAQIKENFGDEALDAEGNFAKEYQTTPRGKQYLELRERASSARSSTELESEIFNHLYSFFSRYYEEGDFMSLRRYSKRDKYAIPYNGEEVYLHWANADQYYIKTGENFTDYSYKQGGWTVCFKLRNASVEHNNVKAAKRFFLPRVDDVVIDTKDCVVTVPFEYRPLSSDEETRYGTKLTQDKILDEAYPKVLAAGKGHNDALSVMVHEKRKDSEGKSVTMLEHHLMTYARRNQTDFFIHKDLKGFLERELDFYLKNEILNIDEIEAGGEARAPRWFQIMTTIKAIGRKIIAFLAQIEDFQKCIFEKRKFVTEANYCLTLDRIPEALYPEIIKNKAQIEEWKALYGVDDTINIKFLKSQPYFVLDTKHFGSDFKDELLASLKQFDIGFDGLVIKSENLQALSLLLEKYRERIKCIHIDPPYNTQTSGFLYKNDYLHSSWIAMMIDRIRLGVEMLNQEGDFLCHIDENEYERLHLIFERFLPDAGTIAWDKRNPMNAGRGIANQHEYIIWRSKQEKPIYLQNDNALTMLEAAKTIVHKHKGVTDKAKKEFAEWIDDNERLSGGEKAYRYLDEQGQIYQSVSLRAPEPRANKKFHQPLIHPITKKPCSVPPNGFSRTPETLMDMVKNGEILFGVDETTQPRQKVLLTKETRKQLSSVIQDAKKGKADLDLLGLDFPYCHPVSLYRDLLGAALHCSNDIVFDFFAGSGTSAHAVINLNLDDEIKRKYILVEVGDHFDAVIKPRLKKIIYSQDWQDGKPVSQRGSSHAFKYMTLESYEDALDNISFQAEDKQDMFKLDDYVLSYMLDFETRQSETLLNVAKLDTPFDYKLKGHGKDKALPVDLPETFNYLIGLHVDSRRVLENKGNRYLVYRGKAEDRRTVIIWRTTSGWDKKEFEQDRDFVLKEKLTDGAEDVFVNTDSFISGARSLDPVFKHRMFNEE